MGDNKNSSVAQFYNQKTVFITGATGFMGKVRVWWCGGAVVWCHGSVVSMLDVQVLVEKLLRSTDLQKVIVLIRPKRNVQTQQRLQTLLSSAVFDRYSLATLLCKMSGFMQGTLHRPWTAGESRSC